MASTTRSEGPKGFSLESSLIRRDRRSSAAAVVLGAFTVPRLRAGLETISKKRLMIAAHHATEGLVPLPVCCRRCAGGRLPATSACETPQAEHRALAARSARA